MRHNQEPQRTVAAENGLKNNPQIYERFWNSKDFFLVKLEKSFECNWAWNAKKGLKSHHGRMAMANFVEHIKAEKCKLV